jgi:hypothetical protein
MDEILQLLFQFMQQLEGSFDELDDAESAEIASFLSEVMGFIQQEEGQRKRPEEQIAEFPIESPVPVGAELLWILSGGQEDAFVNYLRTFPDPSLNSLLRNPELLTNTIARLNQTMPQGQRGQANGIPQAPLDSSNIYGFQYDPKSGHLKVRFQSGSVYSYQGVPPGIFNVFRQGAVPAKTSGQNQFGKWWRGKIPSLGAAFYEMIRSGGYPYQKISG